MFVILVIIAGLLIGWFRKGSLWAIANTKVRYIWVLPGAYVLEYVSMHYLDGRIYEACILLAYVGLIVFCLFNYRLAGVKWALLGTVSNFLVMSLNGLRMPAYLPAVRQIAPQTIPALVKGEYLKSVAMTSHTYLNPLGDIFNVSILTPNIVSIGDLLFSLGIIIFLQRAMRSSLEVNQASAEAQNQ